MHIVVAGWIFVVLLMAAAEAMSPLGTVLGAVLTFVAYGLIPVGLLVTLAGARARRRQRAHRSIADPDRGSETSGDAVASVRKEP